MRDSNKTYSDCRFYTLNGKRKATNVERSKRHKRLCVDGETACFQTFHDLVNLPNFTAGSKSLLAGTTFTISGDNSGAPTENFISQDLKLGLL